MLNELHRGTCIDAFERYVRGTLDVRSHVLADVPVDALLSEPFEVACVYVLRLDLTSMLEPTIRAIPNRLDDMGILYIGGHPSGLQTSRFNKLLRACRRAEAEFRELGYATNDLRHGHTVASCLTTSLLAKGFRTSSCILDLVKTEERVDELELIVGYQERFHHLPPWNTLRGGASALNRSKATNEAVL